MSTVIGYTVKHVLYLSLRLYRPCAGLFSSFTLVYGLTGFLAQMLWYEIKLHTTVHLNVSVEYETKPAHVLFKQQNNCKLYL